MATYTPNPYIPSSFQSGSPESALAELNAGKLPVSQASPIVKTDNNVVQKFEAPKPAPVNPQVTPAVFKQKIVTKYPNGTASDGRRYADIPDVELITKIVRKHPDGVTAEGIKYADYLPRAASPNDSLDYRLSQLESLYNIPKSNFYTDGAIRGQTKKEAEFTDQVSRVQNEGEIMKTLKAPYRGLESVGQNLAYGAAGATADVVDLVGGDDLAGKIRKATEAEQFKTGLLNTNKGLIGGMQSGDLSSVLQTLSSGAGYLATGARIPLYLTALSQGGNMSLEGEQQGQNGFLDKTIAYGTGTLSAAIDRMSGQKVVGGLTKAGIQKETAETFVQRMNNYLKTLKPSDFEAGTEIIQQKIENIGRSLMGVDYDKGIQQYFEVGLLGKLLGKVGDKGFADSPITTLPPKPSRGVTKNIDTLKQINIGTRAKDTAIRNEGRGFNPYQDIAAHQEALPEITKEGKVITKGDGNAVERVEDAIYSINDKLTEAIKKEGVKIPLDEFQVKAMKAAKEFMDEGAMYNKIISQIKSDFEVYSRFADEQGRIDLSKINEIKKAKYGRSNFANPEVDLGNKIVGRAAKELVEDNTSDINTKAINNEMARWYAVRDLLESMDGKTVKGGRLGKYSARLGGLLIGSYFGPIVGFIGAQAGEGIQSSLMKGALKSQKKTIENPDFIKNLGSKKPIELPPASQTSSNKMEGKGLPLSPAPALEQKSPLIQSLSSPKSLDIPGERINASQKSGETKATGGLLKQLAQPSVSTYTLPGAQVKQQSLDIPGKEVNSPIIQKIVDTQAKEYETAKQLSKEPPFMLTEEENKLVDKYAEKINKEAVAERRSQVIKEFDKSGEKDFTAFVKNKIEKLTKESEEAINFIEDEFYNAEAGSRWFAADPTPGQGTNYLVGGTSSTFPTWIPEPLRTKKILMDTIEYIKSGSLVPTRNQKVRELANIIYNQLSPNSNIYAKDSQSFLSKIAGTNKARKSTSSSDKSLSNKEGNGTAQSNSIIQALNKQTPKTPQVEGKTRDFGKYKNTEPGLHLNPVVQAIKSKELATKMSSGRSFYLSDIQSNLQHALKKGGHTVKLTGDDIHGVYTLDEFIDHPKLFEKYKGLKNQEIVLADFHTTKKRGVVSDGKIYLNSKIFAKDKNDAYSTLVHEIEHRLQEIRGQEKYGGDFGNITNKAEMEELAINIQNEFRKSVGLDERSKISFDNPAPKSLPLSQKSEVKYSSALEAMQSPEYKARMAEANKTTGRVTKTSNNLYHTTKAENLDSIMKNGLKTGMKARQEGVSSPTKISFSANEEAASVYGGHDDVMIRTKRSYKPDDLEIDYLAGGEGTYTTGKNIPPEMLEVKIKGKWIPLLEYKK